MMKNKTFLYGAAFFCALVWASGKMEIPANAVEVVMETDTLQEGDTPAAECCRREVVSVREGEITVRCQAFTENKKTPHLPSETFVYKGESYPYLVSRRLTAAMTEEITENIREVIVYRDVEEADHVPQEAVIQAEQGDSGVAVEVVLPAAEAEFDEGRWVDGFTFPIVVERYDAGNYELNGKIISCGEENPFSGYEQDLLELIGVSPAFYQIEHTEWTGEPEEMEDGQIRRTARARGKKYVADCRVTYEGPVKFPSEPGLAYEAVYAQRDPNGETQTVQIHSDSGAMDRGMADADESVQGESWFSRLVTVTSVTISLLAVIVFILFVWFVKRRRRKRKSS